MDGPRPAYASRAPALRGERATRRRFFHPSRRFQAPPALEAITRGAGAKKSRTRSGSARVKNESSGASPRTAFRARRSTAKLRPAASVVDDRGAVGERVYDRAHRQWHGGIGHRLGVWAADRAPSQRIDGPSGLIVDTLRRHARRCGYAVVRPNQRRQGVAAALLRRAGQDRPRGCLSTRHEAKAPTRSASPSAISFITAGTVQWVPCERLRRVHQPASAGELEADAKGEVSRAQIPRCAASACRADRDAHVRRRACRLHPDSQIVTLHRSPLRRETPRRAR